MKNNPRAGAILAAARRVLVRDGADRLTLAAVADEARISIGGVRYHYANKRALLESLVDDFVHRFDNQLAQASGARGSRARAYVEGTFATTPRHSDHGAAPTAGVLAAIAVDSELLAPLRAHYRRWQTLLDDDGLPTAVVTVVRLAMDGYWTAVTLDLAPPDIPTSEALRTHLLALIDEAAGNGAQ